VLLTPSGLYSLPRLAGENGYQEDPLVDTEIENSSLVRMPRKEGTCNRPFAIRHFAKVRAETLQPWRSRKRCRASEGGSGQES
jgi:hypothetical protein